MKWRPNITCKDVVDKDLRSLHLNTNINIKYQDAVALILNTNERVTTELTMVMASDCFFRQISFTWVVLE